MYLSFEEIFDLSVVTQKKVASLLILGLGTLNNFFLPLSSLFLFYEYAFFPFFPSKLVLTKRMRAFNNKEKEEDLWRKWDDRRALSTWKHPQLVEQSTRFYTPGVNTVRCFVCCCLINYISRFVFFYPHFSYFRKINHHLRGLLSYLYRRTKAAFCCFRFPLSLSLLSLSVCVCVFIVLFPARAMMIPHQKRRRERETLFQ